MGPGMGPNSRPPTSEVTMPQAYRPHGTGSVFQECTPTCPPQVTVLDDEGKKRKVRPDHDCPGRWVGKYEAGWTKSGTRRRPKVTAKTKKGAQQKLAAALRDAAAAEAPTVGGKPTVKTWAETWLGDRTGTSRPKSWLTDRSMVTNWIIPTIGHKRLHTLTPADVRAVHKAMDNAGRAPSSIRRAHATLNKMLKDAVMTGHRVPPGPMLVSGPEVGDTGRNPVPLADALRILAVASKRPDASRWAAALLQGMRPGECLGLMWDAVDLEAGVLDVSWQMQALPYKVAYDRSSGFRVPIGYEARQLVGATHLVRPKTKAGKRIIPLVPWMVTALTTWRGITPDSPYGLVWPGLDGADARGEQDRDAWRALLVEAKVTEEHDLYASRHTTATLLRAGGIDDETITAIIGHSSILSTQAYLHTDQTRARAALEQIAGTLELG